MSVRLRHQLSLAKSRLMYELYPGRLARMRRFYSQFVGAGDLCFDIGAHIGNRARVLASIGCDVVAVEPHPFLARYLRRKCAPDPHIHVHEAAVGDTSGEVKLHASPAHLTVSSIDKNWAESLLAIRPHRIRFEEELDVQMTTLDALIKAFGVPKYVKIDVEGVDTRVLRGLSQAIDIVSFEHLPHVLDQSAEALAILESLAPYRHNFFPRESHRFCLDKPVRSTDLLEAIPKIVDQQTACDIFSFKTRE